MPQPTEGAQRQRRSDRSRSADAYSPRNSPRDIPSAGHGVSPRQHPPSPPSHPEHSRQQATDAHSHHEHGTNAGTHAQPLQGATEHDGSMSTPDLSPRGDLEAEDPPTPRMYKAIIPTAAPGAIQKPDIAFHHGPKLKPETSQVVLHQGRFEHSRQHSSPQRHTEHKGQLQAMEDLRQTVRYAASPWTTVHSSSPFLSISRAHLLGFLHFCTLLHCLHPPAHFSKLVAVIARSK